MIGKYCYFYLFPLPLERESLLDYGVIESLLTKLTNRDKISCTKYVLLSKIPLNNNTTKLFYDGYFSKSKFESYFIEPPYFTNLYATSIINSLNLPYTIVVTYFNLNNFEKLYKNSPRAFKKINKLEIFTRCSLRLGQDCFAGKTSGWPRRPSRPR